MNVDHEAVRKAYPSVITISDDYYDGDGVTVTVDQAQVDAARATLDAEAAATLYQRQRTGEAGTTDTIYASWGDQMDMQYKDLINGTTTWKDHVAAVKAKYPKP
tara:strand:- start:51 stop:362 length:312 start_codon:yes stop_codon:yes gene_type:complete